PCTPAAGLLYAHATPHYSDYPAMHGSRPQHSRPPDASPRVYLPGQSPPLPAVPGVPTTVLRSLPTQSGTRAPSPENRCVPEHRGSRLPATVRDPPSGTSALPLPSQMDPVRTSPPSTPAHSNNHALPRLLRCTPRPLLPQALVHLHHPIQRPGSFAEVCPAECTGAAIQSAF